MWKVPLFELNYDEAESQAVQAVLNSKWLTMGEKTIQFENSFREMLQNEDTNCTFVANCSSALYMALLVLNLEHEDEVIIPALTFVADLNAVIMAGAKPVLADCGSLDNWNITAESIRKQITSKTKAIIVVHFAGYPCDMDPILDLCKEYNLKLIEDVAHAPGASYKGNVCGTIGDIGCFSFFTNKNLSIGEGGMLSTSDSEINTNLRHIRSHGMSSLTLDRHKGRVVSYDVIRPGLNFRSDEIHAALGLVQLSKLFEANNKRKKITAFYRQALKGISGISIPFPEHVDFESSYHIFPILLDESIDRLQIIQGLKEAGIQSSIHYPSFHQFTAYKEFNLNATPVAEQISNNELTLPLFSDLTEEQVTLIANTLAKAVKKQK